MAALSIRLFSFILLYFSFHTLKTHLLFTQKQNHVTEMKLSAMMKESVAEPA